MESIVTSVCTLFGCRIDDLKKLGRLFAQLSVTAFHGEYYNASSAAKPANK